MNILGLSNQNSGWALPVMLCLKYSCLWFFFYSIWWIPAYIISLSIVHIAEYISSKL